MSLFAVHLLNNTSCQTIQQKVDLRPLAGASHLLLSFSQFFFFLLQVDTVSLNDLASASLAARSQTPADLGTMTIWMKQMKTKTSEAQATYAPNLESTCLEYWGEEEKPSALPHLLTAQNHLV